MNYRLPTGGLIDRAKTLSFTFNKVKMQGYEGDTIASALLANGVTIVNRSFKYHRPRGIYSAGVEEPNAIFTIEMDGQITPNVRATITALVDGMVIRSQSGFPSVGFDIGSGLLSLFSRLMPPGFYYKTFMFPKNLWMFYEKFIRKAASSAPVPSKSDTHLYDHSHAHCDVLIVGSGPAGIAAALTVAKSGLDLILAEMSPYFGGELLNAPADDINDKPATVWLAESLAYLRSCSNVQVLPHTTVQGYHDYNYLIAEQTLHSVAKKTRTHCQSRLWKIRAQKVILATGAIERPMVFAGNDTPGVMSASAVQTYIHRYGVVPGRSILFFTNNDSAYPVAIQAQKAGANVEIIDIRKNENGHWQVQADKEKIQIHSSAAIVGSMLNNGDIMSVHLGKLNGNTATHYSSHAYHKIAVAGGWTPTVHLFSHSGGKLKWNQRLNAFVPDVSNPLNPCVTAGAINGFLDLAKCLEDGTASANAAIQFCNGTVPEPTPIKTAASNIEQEALHLPIIPSIHPLGQGDGKHFVDFMNDVTAFDIELSAQEGYQSVEHMKRYTAAGFGTDQGKTGNINALRILAQVLNKSPSEVGHTTYRPNYTPVSYGVITGHDKLRLFAQSRTTAIDHWHKRHNVIYEDVGDWKRARYFPVNNETMDESVWRECKAARKSVAAMDASTLGKIDIQGPDAAQFLDMIYTNMFSNLAVGRCRYGMMLRETGMIFDDGVTARLGENHFHLTTSTGHAAAVMTWLEEWLQTEWPDLKVFCTSVTEQWSVIALVGPKARDLLNEITDIDLDNESFPFMSFKEGKVCGSINARIFRISFSGETAFEINVPACTGLAVWESLFKLGKKYNITPYGTEAMHVLRAEKGYIIVGQDSDGTMTPLDLGLDWMLSKKKKDYLGRRSLARPDMLRKGRMQFVGLLPDDPKAVITEGSQIVSKENAKPPTTTQGFVTSSYMSPTLERSFALAMIDDGFNRHGETIYAVTMDNKTIAAQITGTVFWDKEGIALRG